MRKKFEMAHFLAESLNIANSVIVDIRLPSEWYEFGVLPGSKLITFETLRGGINPMFLPTISSFFQKDDEIILMCYSGARTKDAIKFLNSHGFTRVSDITGGAFNYQRLGAKFEPYKG